VIVLPAMPDIEGLIRGNLDDCSINDPDPVAFPLEERSLSVPHDSSQQNQDRDYAPNHCLPVQAAPPQCI